MNYGHKEINLLINNFHWKAETLSSTNTRTVKGSIRTVKSRRTPKRSTKVLHKYMLEITYIYSLNTTRLDSEEGVPSLNSPFQRTNIPTVLILPGSQPSLQHRKLVHLLMTLISTLVPDFHVTGMHQSTLNMRLGSLIVQTKAPKGKKKTTPQLTLLCYCYIKVTVGHAYNDVVLISIGNILKLHEIRHIGQ